ncbi:MAG: hypothetical protein H8E64_07600 [Candidatus Marinimicrobia bacterium]|nr:hypothetical protein [Candidatus Neomarinimicrobiota bacterium]
MSSGGNKPLTPLFAHPLEVSSGMTVSDLNRYLPAIRGADDIQMEKDQMREGLFHVDGAKGLENLPENSIDLVIADPPETPMKRTNDHKTHFTLQEYYQWNERWITEVKRVLKSTGAIYLLSGWRLSGMYHSLLSSYFHVQSRITWRNEHAGDQPRIQTWTNTIGDIWFATKTNEFMINQRSAGKSAAAIGKKQINFWADILHTQHSSDYGDKPESLIQRILNVSSFKLNWVLDPFMGNAGVGIVAKKMGRRFIGFETDQDKLLMAMKRMDKT